MIFITLLNFLTFNLYVRIIFLKITFPLSRPFMISYILPYFLIIAMTIQEWIPTCSCIYFQYKILMFKTNILLFITSIILIFKGEVKNYTRWEWKTWEWTTLILPSPSPSQHYDYQAPPSIKGFITKFTFFCSNYKALGFLQFLCRSC